MSPGDPSQALTTGRCILGHVACALAASASSGVCPRCRIQVAPDLLGQDLPLTSPGPPRMPFRIACRGPQGDWASGHNPAAFSAPSYPLPWSPTPHQQLIIIFFSQCLLQETPPKRGVEAPETLILSRNQCPQLPAHPEHTCSGVNSLHPGQRWMEERG